MPLRRTPRGRRETREARALREAVAADTAAMLARIPDDGKTKAERQRADAKTGQRVDRVMSKARAKWDAAPPAWREQQGAKILADARRRDQSATLPVDGGREIYAVCKLSDDAKRRAKKSASTGTGATLHTSARAVTAEAVRPAPVLEAEPVVEASPKPQRTRRRPRAGHAGYFDMRLIDDDEWDD